LLTSLLFLALCFALPLIAAESITGKVVSVADGDTITVLEDKTQIKVRLHGVDAPEKAQDFGTVSRTFTSDLCFGEEVTVEVTDTDRYGRKVGIVRLSDGRVLNHALVEAGLAHWYEEYAPKDETLKRLQAEAKAAKRGVWSRSDVVPPWEFRKKKRAPKMDDETVKTVEASEEILKPAVVLEASGDVYITDTGNKYHRGSCRTLKKSKTAIASADAKARGYGACGICF
jgi:endonuclease YncB( thermonuclease family)